MKSRDVFETCEKNDLVKIVNHRQAAWYWQHNVVPHVYLSKDLKTGEPIIAYAFSKSETQELYKEWLAMRPNKENQ